MIITIMWKKHPPIAWYILLTDRGKLSLIFFCHSVEVVIARRAIKEDITPITGRLDPISKPKTRAAPINPSTTPTHCLKVTISSKNFPAKALVSIGCKVTINAAIPVGIPIET